jgi:hypothetical protein
MQFDYEYDGAEHKYYPDFRIDGQLIEIKGSHFFENKDPNGKMVNPYDHSLDALYEAKHQCMIANNVHIIVDCNEQIRYVSTKYGADFLPSCRNGDK